MPIKKRATSLSDHEVSIAKRLLTLEGYNNQKVLTVINTKRVNEGKPPINGGRISQIKNNYPTYKKIKSCSETEALEFVKTVYDNKPNIIHNSSPIDHQRLKELLPIASKSPLKVNVTETDQIEFKISFNIKNAMRAFPAFANNKGG